MDKQPNQKGWLLVLPVVVVVAFSAVVPLMTVVNYSVQDTFGNNQFFWNGVGWFAELLDPQSELGARFLEALWRNLLFSAIVLAIEIPLGVVVALAMPRQGWTVAFAGGDGPAAAGSRGTSWAPSGRSSPPAATSASSGAAVNGPGSISNYNRDPFAAWATVVVMDVWHWTSLVAPLCYAGLKAIPEAYYQAAHRRRVALGRVPDHPASPRCGAS
jgi:glycerol transport system permease protein